MVVPLLQTNVSIGLGGDSANVNATVLAAVTSRLPVLATIKLFPALNQPLLAPSNAAWLVSCGKLAPFRVTLLT